MDTIGVITSVILGAIGAYCVTIAMIVAVLTTAHCTSRVIAVTTGLMQQGWFTSSNSGEGYKRLAPSLCSLPIFGIATIVFGARMEIPTTWTLVGIAITTVLITFVTISKEQKVEKQAEANTSLS